MCVCMCAYAHIHSKQDSSCSLTFTICVIIWIEHSVCLGLVKKLVQGELGNSVPSSVLCVHKTHREAEDDDNESFGDGDSIDDNVNVDDCDGGDGGDDIMITSMMM